MKKLAYGAALSITALVGSPSQAHAYNRTASASYAGTYYSIPNSYYFPFSNDCANFVSQCLRAGGWSYAYGYSQSLPYVWWRPDAVGTGGSYSWTQASSLERFVYTSGRGYLTSDWRSLRPGDLIFTDWGDGVTAPGSPDGTTDHVMIVLSNSGSDILYAQHSPNRLRSLNNVRSLFWRARFWYYRLND